MAPKVLICGMFNTQISHENDLIYDYSKGDLAWAHEEAKQMFDGIAEIVVRLPMLIFIDSYSWSSLPSSWTLKIVQIS